MQWTLPRFIRQLIEHGIVERLDRDDTAGMEVHPDVGVGRFVLTDPDIDIDLDEDVDCTELDPLMGGGNPSVTAIPTASVPAKAMPKDPLSNVVDLSDGDEDNGGGRLSPFREDGGAGDRKVEKREENDGLFPRKKRRRDEENFNNFVGHEIIDGEDEDDGKDAHLDELMDGLDDAQKPVVLSDSEPSDGMQSESDDDDELGRDVVDLSDGEYRAPGEYVPVANKKHGKSENSSKKPSSAPVDPLLSASFAGAKKLYYDKLKAKNKVAVAAAPLPKPLFALPSFFQDFDQGEPELDSDCEIAQEWELGEGKKKKCRVRLEILSERKLERLLMAPSETPETIVTAPIRRVPVGSRWGHEGVTTMLGQKLKIRRQPTKQEEKAAAAAEAAKTEAVKTEPEVPVESSDQPDRPVRSTRGKNKKYDDGDFKEGEFSDKMSESDDDDDAPLSSRKKKRKRSGSGSDDDEDDDAPLSSMRKKRKREGSKSASEKEDGDDEDDEPLKKKKKVVRYRDCKQCDACKRRLSQPWKDCGECQVCKDKEKEREKEKEKEEKENDKDKSGSEDDEPLSAKKGKGKTMAGTPRLRNNYFCGKCDGCQRKDDCSKCRFCKDKPKFGGPNKLKKKCEERVCINKTPVEYNPKTKKLQQKCLGMKCTDQIPIKARSKKPKRNPDDSDFRASGSSGDSSGSSGDEERREKRRNISTTTEIRLLHTIDPRLERNWFTKESHCLIGKPLKHESTTRHWIR